MTRRRADNLMKNYAKVKLSLSARTTIQANQAVPANADFMFLADLLPQNVQVFRQADLNNIISYCPRWTNYCNIYNSFKVTGMSIEATPTSRNSINNGVDYVGSIMVGILPQSNANVDFNALSESNYKMVLSTENKTRKYWKFINMDFNGVPAAVGGAPPYSSLPLSLYLRKDTTAQIATARFMNFNFIFTFYVTFRQNMS